MSKTIIDFLHDWVRDKSLREAVLHREKKELKDKGGLKGPQIDILTGLKLEKIARRICEEIGVDIDELFRVIYEDGSSFDAMRAAAYDEGRTHIRRVSPKVLPLNTSCDLVLSGHGFRSDTSRVTVKFVLGPVDAPTKEILGTVEDVECGIDVWQRIHVKVTLDVEGEWLVRAQNDDDPPDPETGDPIAWSKPAGMVYVVT